jgi:hypothetical protein
MELFVTSSSLRSQHLYRSLSTFLSGNPSNIEPAHVSSTTNEQDGRASRFLTSLLSALSSWTA